MNKTIFCSHGRLCEGMIDTLKIFSLYDENAMIAIPFYTDGIDAEVLLEKELEKLSKEDVVVIFTDVQFGSVNQLVMQKTIGLENVHVISGMNLMVVLEILSQNHPFEEEFIRQKVLDSRQSIIYMKDMKYSFQEDDE